MNHAPRRAVLASDNPGKLRELRALLAEIDLKVLPQRELGITPAEETGASFLDNALIKARHVARQSGLPAIADDSGIEVDALNGAPGVHSARYAGANASDQDNLLKLIEAILDVPESARSARYQCVIAFVRSADDMAPVIGCGTWEGRLITTPRGEHGFGYDPIFLVPEYGRTAAELPPELKNRLSHRGQALRALLAKLREQRTADV
jgi:XTP/dITP diphosphohydrolase